MIKHHGDIYAVHASEAAEAQVNALANLDYRTCIYPYIAIPDSTLKALACPSHNTTQSLCVSSLCARCALACQGSQPMKQHVQSIWTHNCMVFFPQVTVRELQLCHLRSDRLPF